MMYFEQQKADDILKEYEKIWFNNLNVVYIAVVENNDLNCDRRFYLERGIKSKKGFDTNFAPIPRDIDPIKQAQLNIDKSTSNSIYKDRGINIKDEVVGDAEPQISSSHKIRPMLGGIAIQNNENSLSYGTLGCFVKLKEHNKIYILTNHHVAAKLTHINIPNTQDESIIFQPGQANSGYKDYTEVFGRIEYGHYGHFTDIENEHLPALDFCFIRVDDNKNVKKGFFWTTEELNTHEYAIKGIEKLPYINANVFKYGATTGYTKGIVRSVNATVRMNNVNSGSPKIIFRKQILTNSMSKKGDSGSVIIDEKSQNILGLLHGGDSKNYSVCNNINHIFNVNLRVKQGEYTIYTKIELNQFLT